MDYKDTLNLPKTKFPMKANLPNREPEIMKFWDSINLYQSLRKENQNKPKYILHDGPPYANGDIHIGHAVNKILKDIVIKSKTASGYDCPFVPGWDCHGLPIELMVEKKFGKSKFRENKNAFRKACREYAHKQVEKQKKDFIRLGISADWDNSYLSMDKDFEASIIESLGDILANDHIYFGSKPVHWCIESESALAEAEVEYKDVESDAVYVLFKLVKNNLKINTKKDIYLMIWTTTPWTLPANRAVAVNIDVQYVLVEDKDRVYVLAEDLLESLNSVMNTSLQSVDSVNGKDLIGLSVNHPFYNFDVPIIFADHVTTESGSGIVHIAPGHGQEDYKAGIENDLEIFNPVNDKGCFDDGLEFFGGLNVRDANSSIISKLKENNCLLHQHKYHHSYPHCWRFKTPLIFRATPQWFVSMDNNNLREKILSSINDVEWIPGWGEDRIRNMMDNRPDWCISRQRFWGVPIPFFVNKKTNELHPNTPNILKVVSEIVRKDNIESWFEYDKSSLIENSDDYEIVTDTLDVWFDSGVTHQAVVKNRNLGDISDLYLEGSDQHRGWFQSSLITSLAINGKVPYKKVLTHGFVVDGEGQKMSKSLGNVISPQDIIKEKGSDILRLWIANTDYTKEMTISDEILTRTSESYRRIRNTIKFLLSNINDYTSDGQIQTEDMPLVDKWILNETQNLQDRVTRYYEEFKFHQITQDIQNFCTIYLGGYYLDIIKDRLYTVKTDSMSRRSCQETCKRILKILNKIISPILSFTAEEVFNYYKIKDEESVFYTEWPEHTCNLSDKEQEIGNVLFQLRQTVSKELDDARNANKIGSSLDANIILKLNHKKFNLLKDYEDELKFIFISSSCDIVDNGNDNDEITINSSPHKKCTRCWHKHESVGTIEGHPEICERCFSNIEGDGETRKLA